MTTCKRCGVAGHQQKTCANPGVDPMPRFPPTLPVAFVPPADRPFHHAASEQNGPAEPDLPGWVHTWCHVRTGAEIVATWPPFSWEDMDGMVVLRHVRDAAHVRVAYPAALVMERPPTAGVSDDGS